ncbi:MAG TPA: hypothetical protein VFA18_13610, partial [Gemmataceae bacterium]|nr:hypothetical protein [Gemmataceae bacterium]
RVLWTRYAEDLAARLPAAATLDSFHGFAELDTAGGRGKQAAKPKRQLLVTASAALAKHGSVPPEIESFASLLQARDRRQTDFPVLSLPDIQLRPASNGQAARASVTVLCLPASIKTPARSKTPAGRSR